MIRAVFVIFIILFNFFFQSTLLEFISIWGIVPNTAITIIVSYALLRGSTGGAIVGFAAGLLTDVFFGSAVGFYAIVFMYIGYLCGLPSKDVFKNNFILPVVFTAGSTLIFGFVTYVFQYLLRARTDFGYYFLNITLPQVIYTAVFSLITYSILRFINYQIEKSENKKRKLFE